jgi:hypothetical protein
MHRSWDEMYVKIWPYETTFELQLIYIVLFRIQFSIEWYMTWTGSHKDILPYIDNFGLSLTNGSIVLESDRILQSDPIGSDSWVKLHPIVLIKWIVIKWGVIMILPSDPLVIPQPGFRSDFFGWSDPTRSDRVRYRIHRPGSVIVCSYFLFSFSYRRRWRHFIDGISFWCNY